jgi:nucleoside-triphosphatase
MSQQSTKVLLTGLPGCGKTTAVMKIIDRLDTRRIAGFYTQEIRQNDTRKGFRWISLDGTAGTLAHVDVNSRFKVGKYRVDVKGFEESVVPLLEVDRPGIRLFVIDEIGKMECLSGRFVRAVSRLFASDRAILATVAQKGTKLIAEAKKYPGVRLFNLTRQNCDEFIGDILEALSFLQKPE